MKHGIVQIFTHYFMSTHHYMSTHNHVHPQYLCLESSNQFYVVTQRGYYILLGQSICTMGIHSAGKRCCVRLTLKQQVGGDGRPKGFPWYDIRNRYFLSQLVFFQVILIIWLPTSFHLLNMVFYRCHHTRSPLNYFLQVGFIIKLNLL